MSRYEKFAEYYDRLMYDCDYETWSQSLYAQLKGKGAETGLDLACGTGKMTYLLAEHFQMIGVDCSEAMLTQAQKKRKRPGNPLFLCQDMAEFEIFDKVDFITAICDGVNYLKGEKIVRKFFRRCFDSLRPNGMFFFDVSSEYKLKRMRMEKFYFEDEEDWTYFWTNTGSGKKVEMQLVFFVKNGQNYERFDETHVQYIYAEQDLLKWLTETGFRAEMYGDPSGGPVRKDSERIYFKAVKYGSVD